MTRRLWSRKESAKVTTLAAKSKAEYEKQQTLETVTLKNLEVVEKPFVNFCLSYSLYWSTARSLYNYSKLKNRRVGMNEICSSPKKLIQTSKQNLKQRSSQRLVEHIELMRKTSGTGGSDKFLK